MWQTKGDPLDMARAWICECRDTHKQCHNLKDYDLPTRLVSIGESAVKLVATTTLDIVPSYATLSYCWGAEDFTMLTSDTLQSFLAEIPTQELPKTFQDAIEIARELGLAYIWIDALCIIQREEGSHDWHQEAGRMVSVYGGASINIAASSSSDARGGCFTKSEYFSGGFVTKVRTGTGERVQNFHSQTVYAESTTETYLARRAWTLQEKLLAPRTLYVGDHGLFWECRSTIKSEFHPDGFEDILGSHLVVPEDQPWDWTEIVRLYSAANLTFASDRLPALSGIAKRQQAATSNTYIAGMWRQKLVEELTWGLQNPRKRQHRPKIGVPSWAWASAGSAVSCRYLSSDSDSVKEYVRVEDAWTTTADTDQYGAVTDGELLLGCCNLFLGYLQVESDLEVGSADKAETEAVILNGMDEALPVVLDCLDDLPMRKGEPIYLMPLRGGESGSGISVPVDGNEESADDHDWRDVEIDGRVVEDILVYGIVIKQVNNLKGHFRRIGSFEFKHHAISYPDKCGDGRCYYHEFLALLEKHDMSTAESECMRLSSDAECAEFRYVISIK